MIARVKTWLAVAGAVALLLVGTWWKADATGYARGVRDQKIITLAETTLLNAALRAARAKTTNAALDFEIQRRELTEMERRLADERAKDPLGDGECISDAGWVRYFSIRP